VITGITLVGFSVTSGRVDVNSQAQAGYASIKIINTNNTIYDWTINTGITLEVKNSLGNFIPIFGGRISDLSIGVQSSGEIATVTSIDIYALGALSKIQNAVWNGSLSKKFDGLQIADILQDLLVNSWNEVPPAETWASYNATETWEDAQNVGLGQIDTGEYEMISRSAAPVNMYALVAEIANSGLGYLFEDANGLISYGDASRRQEYLLANGYIELDGNHALIDGIKATIRQGDLVNEVTINYKNNYGTSYTYEDSASIGQFGLFARSVQSRIDDDPDAEDVAERFVQLRAYPKAKFDSITFAIQNPEIDDSDRDSLLGVFMGMPVAIQNLPANITGGSFQGYVEGWNFKSTLKGLSITLTVSPTEFSAFSQNWAQVEPTLIWDDVNAILTWQNATGVIN
jgi:hypothetical protein